MYAVAKAHVDSHLANGGALSSSSFLLFLYLGRSPIFPPIFPFVFSSFSALLLFFRDRAGASITSTCNLHSWASSSKWYTPFLSLPSPSLCPLYSLSFIIRSGCCYYSDHRNAACMWNKPREIDGYTCHFPSSLFLSILPLFLSSPPPLLSSPPLHPPLLPLPLFSSHS